MAKNVTVAHAVTLEQCALAVVVALVGRWEWLLSFQEFLCEFIHACVEYSEFDLFLHKMIAV